MPISINVNIEKVDKERFFKGKKGRYMPLKKGKSEKVVSQNIREFHSGKTYQHTLKKFGRNVANKQAIAAALSIRRRSK